MDNSSPSLALADVPLVLKRQIVPVSFIVLLGLICALCFSVYLPRQYEATAKIMVEPTPGAIFLRSGAENGLSHARVDSEVEIFKADPVYLAVIRKLGLAQKDLQNSNAWWSNWLLFSTPSETERYLVALDELKRKTHIRRIGTTQIIDVIVRDENRMQAAFLANSLAQSFVELRQDNQIEMALAQRKRLDALTQQARADLNRAEKALADFLKNNATSPAVRAIDQHRLELQRNVAQVHYETALAEQSTATAETMFPAVNVKLVANATQPIRPTYPNVRVLALALFFAFVLLAGWVAIRLDHRQKEGNLN